MKIATAIVVGFSLLGLGCGAALRPFPLQDVLWTDPDAQPFEPTPEEYYSPFAWDAADQTIFRPITRFFAVDPGGEAVNVNALDEVPDSSWFTNRLGRHPLTPAELARGACRTEPLDPTGPWTVTGAKPNGANPGFIIEDQAGQNYLLKFDGTVQGPRATAADVIVSRLYHGAGYFTPCNRIVFFDREILRIAPDATSEDEQGDEVPMSERDLDKIFAKALRLGDGRYRASSSLFLDGKPLGPFRYQGTRDDDPNDVIPHEDRRELRGSRVLAAWTNHFDSREQNTLDMWIERGDKGFVRHHIIDFGDCFGSIWEPPMLGRRIGHSHYLDPGDVAVDFVTLGIPTRPWDRARFGASGAVYGYYDVEQFDPAAWKPGYPNPAMSRMTERDGAWMARIISRFSDAHLQAAIATGKLRAPLANELFRILVARRDKALARYLSRVSALGWPRLQKQGDKHRLCLRDSCVQAGLVHPEQRRYQARAWRRYQARAWRTVALEPTAVSLARAADAEVCVELPAAAGAAPKSPRYLIVDVAGFSGSQSQSPARVHLYHLGSGGYRIVGLERPYDDDPPGG